MNVVDSSCWGISLWSQLTICLFLFFLFVIIRFVLKLQIGIFKCRVINSLVLHDWLFRFNSWGLYLNIRFCFHLYFWHYWFWNMHWRVDRRLDDHCFFDWHFFWSFTRNNLFFNLILGSFRLIEQQIVFWSWRCESRLLTRVNIITSTQTVFMKAKCLLAFGFEVRSTVSIRITIDNICFWFLNMIFTYLTCLKFIRICLLIRWWQSCTNLVHFILICKFFLVI